MSSLADAAENGPAGATKALPRAVPWSDGRWTTPPVDAHPDGDDLVVTAAEGSDAWRTTAYGFVHDTEHALLAPFHRGQAIEVSFTADLTEQFDQAGVFLRLAPDRWVKAGLEVSDGVLQLGAVVTAPVSDWSVAPVPSWFGRRVTLRASWAGDAVTLRARVDDEPLRLVRVLPFGGPAPAASPDAHDAPDALDAPGLASAGPFACAPTRAGLTVRFHDWRLTEPDAALH